MNDVFYDKELTSKDLTKKHDEFIRELSMIMSVQMDNRNQCLSDRKFATIGQWDTNIAAQFANKPRLEVNKIQLSLIRIFNEYRHNRITVDFISKDGSKSDDLADLCDGLYRANEQDSNAKEAYDNAFEEGTAGGIGAWRYTARYVDDGDPDDDRQEICIEPIHDADRSVFFDLGSKRQDKADARRCYVIEHYVPEDFEAEWGYNLDKDSLPSGVPEMYSPCDFDWVSDNSVAVAEVYEIEKKKEPIYIWELVGGDVKRLNESEHESEKAMLKATNAKLKKVKKIERSCVHKYIISGDRILEDCGIISGTYIPVTMFFGKRWVIDNIERCMGHVRLSRDIQMVKNMQISALAELASLSVTEKPIFVPEQVLPHAEMWSNENIQKYRYMLVDPVTSADGTSTPLGPVGMLSSPAIPPALAALLQLTDGDIEDVLGNQQNGEQLAGNVSTDTAMLVQNRIDMQTYIYMDNFARAMEHGGRIWLGMARDIYVEPGRVVKTINEQKETSHQTLSYKKIDKNGLPIITNDFGRVKMDVLSSVGPSSSTAKNAMVRSLNNMMGYITDPETQAVLTNVILMNMDGEGLKPIREFYRKKLLVMGVLEPTEIEAEEMRKKEEQASQNLSVQDQYFLAEAEKARAQAAKSQSDIILTQARADETRAKTMETMQGIDAQKQTQALQAMKAFNPSITPPSVTGVDTEGF